MKIPMWLLIAIVIAAILIAGYYLIDEFNTEIAIAVSSFGTFGAFVFIILKHFSDAKENKIKSIKELYNNYILVTSNKCTNMQNYFYKIKTKKTEVQDIDVLKEKYMLFKSNIADKPTFNNSDIPFLVPAEVYKYYTIVESANLYAYYYPVMHYISKKIIYSELIILNNYYKRYSINNIQDNDLDRSVKIISKIHEAFNQASGFIIGNIIFTIRNDWDVFQARHIEEKKTIRTIMVRNNCEKDDIYNMKLPLKNIIDYVSENVKKSIETYINYEDVILDALKR